MDSSMLGVGVGFDTKGSNKHKIHIPNNEIKNFHPKNLYKGELTLSNISNAFYNLFLVSNLFLLAVAITHSE